MKQKIYLGIDHPKHGKCTIAFSGDLTAIGWVGRVIEDGLRHDAHPANVPIEPYTTHDIERLVRGELKT